MVSKIFSAFSNNAQFQSNVLNASKEPAINNLSVKKTILMSLAFTLLFIGGVSGKTPSLLTACYENDLNAIQELISGGADINQQDEDGWTALFEACSSGNVEVVTLLVEAGADLNIQDSFGCTALMYIFDFYYDVPTLKEKIKFLVEAGADVNIQDNLGRTVLYEVVCRGDISTVEYLLNVGIDATIQDNDGLDAICVAEKYNYENILKLLRWFLTEKMYLEVMKEKLANGMNVNEQDENGETPLFEECLDGRAESVKYLVKSGAKINIQNNFGRTALIEACVGGHLPVVKFLVDSGADVNIEDQLGCTALAVACSKQYYEVVKILINAGADTSI